MGRFLGTLYPTAPSRTPAKGVRPFAPSRSATDATTTAPRSAPLTPGTALSASKAPTRSPSESSTWTPPPPPHPQDKGKQPAEDQTRKRRQFDNKSGPIPDVQPRNIMADTRREAHCRYVNFVNNETIARARLMNIKEAFHSLPHHICVPMQYMNESVSSDEWTRIDSLNNIMHLAYKISYLAYLTNFLFYL